MNTGVRGCDRQRPVGFESHMHVPATTIVTSRKRSSLQDTLQIPPYPDFYGKEGYRLMLNIRKTIQNGTVTFELEGRLDTVSAPELQAAVDEAVGDAAAVVFDFKKLQYLSSAGLRVLLTTQQIMEETGRPDVTVCDANDDIQGVFIVTGFNNVLNIK